MNQASLFEDESPIPIPIPVPGRMGRVEVRSVQSRSILSRASGQADAYDFTLNPYVGCAFGCAYCYAAFFVPDEARAASWGEWVDVKTNALALLMRQRRLPGARVYLGSVTDPYQPVERETGLTRSLLAFMVELKPQPRIVVQTRSDLVLRDVDLLRRFAHLRVNVTVTTDSDAVRKRFEPACPGISRRLAALRELKAAGLRTGACLSPLLPVENVPEFAATIAALDADVVVAQQLHTTRGRFAAGTREPALELARESGWNEAAYARTVAELRSRLPHLYEGKDGFFPE